MAVGKDHHRNTRKVNEETKIFINKFNTSKSCSPTKNLTDPEQSSLNMLDFQKFCKYTSFGKSIFFKKIVFENSSHLHICHVLKKLDLISGQRLAWNIIRASIWENSPKTVA